MKDESLALLMPTSQYSTVYWALYYEVDREANCVVRSTIFPAMYWSIRTQVNRAVRMDVQAQCWRRK